MSVTLTIINKKTLDKKWYSVDHHESWVRIMNYIKAFPGVELLDGDHTDTLAFTHIVFDTMDSYESYAEAIKTNDDFIARDEYYASVGITTQQSVD